MRLGKVPREKKMQEYNAKRARRWSTAATHVARASSVEGWTSDKVLNATNNPTSPRRQALLRCSRSRSPDTAGTLTLSWPASRTQAGLRMQLFQSIASSSHIQVHLTEYIFQVSSSPYIEAVQLFTLLLMVALTPQAHLSQITSPIDWVPNFFLPFTVTWNPTSPPYFQ